MTAIAQAPVPEGDAPSPGPTPPAPRPRARPKLPRLPRRSDKGFHRALGIALAVHLLLMLGILTVPDSMIPESLTKSRLGERDADPDGVSVEIVDVADLQSRSNAPLRGSMPDQPTPQPQQSQPQAQPQPPPEPQAQPQEEQQEPQQQPQAAEPQRQPAPKEKAQEKSEVVEAPGTPPPPPSEAPAEKPKPPPPQKQASRPPNPTPPQQQPRVLDLRVPPSALNITPRDFGASRPPGTTRSGENDQFFQGVIRALWRTFPELRTTGIVGIRFLLNTKGNMVNISVSRTSGDSNLDQTVVFAVKQASFPIPPDNSTEVDRTFLITYIYK